MKKQSILCPGAEHSSFKKTLLFKDNDGVFAYCKTHGWMKIQFLKDGKPISFEGTAVMIEPCKWDFVDAEPTPTVSIGKINRKCRQT